MLRETNKEQRFPEFGALLLSCALNIRDPYLSEGLNQLTARAVSTPAAPDMHNRHWKDPGYLSREEARQNPESGWALLHAGMTVGPLPVRPARNLQVLTRDALGAV